MKIAVAELWRPTGTVDRGTYALVGVLGFALKHNLDRLIAAYVFRRPWGFFNYWVPVRDVVRITALSRQDALFLATMLTFSLPFIWVGVTMTQKRLRSANLPPQLLLLFFVPVLNLLFFLFLCLTPERASATQHRAPHERTKSGLVQLLPESALGSAAVSLLITVPMGVGTALFGTLFLTHYGWGLFVALPFTMGFAASLIYGLRQPRGLTSCVGVACLAVTLFGLVLLAMAVEGMFCIAMLLPLALPLAAFGGIFGFLVQRRRWIQSGAPAFISALILLAPGVEWTEHVIAPVPPVFVVRSSIDIQAPPERVWRQVVAFTEIPPPSEWMFRVGIAYPIRAEMLGSGPGAERHCVFSTGAFVEPIEVWDEPHRLKFSVETNPAPMNEWTPYFHIDPPHLHGFFVSNGGQFLLTPLSNGGTHLEGTTWYRHTLWPAAYWKLWSDAIIHKIHMRVLRHIRDEVENRAQSSWRDSAASECKG
jgi:Polyketide cyclase / dehydrase and lipid transport